MNKILCMNLLSFPSRRAVKDSFLLFLFGLAINLFLIVWYYTNDLFGLSYNINESHVFSMLCFISSILNVIFTLKITCNFIFLLRYFLFWILSFFSSLSYSVFGDSVYLANFGSQHQTIDITMILLLSLLTACSSISIALALLSSKEHSEFKKDNLYYNDYIGHGQAKKLMFFGIVLSFVFTAYLVWREGGFLLLSGVGYREEMHEGVKFGAGGSFVIIGACLILLSSLNFRDHNVKLVVMVILLIFIMQLLAGKRADNLFPMLIMLVILNNLIRNNYRVNYVYSTIMVTLIVVLAEFVGKARVDAIFVIDYIKEQEAGNVLQMFTANQVLGTFYAVKYNLEQGVFELLYGSSYLEYFLKLPPAFIGLSRPEELEGKMYIGSQVMAQGGIFELSEAYWNFGFLGVIFIPFVITYLLGFLLKLSHKYKAYALLFLLFFLALGLSSLRGVWYQNFAYVRGMSVLLIVSFFVTFLCGNVWRLQSYVKCSD
ncbi:O-antigen polysaccharide polymerase Wzy [Vibrio vulnificus]|uniref:O-antigen polysaccharide polymerase Wzy n=1 Tax=Vibrio vulnificus TaxID=672 RepID=UPI003EDB055E